MRSDLLRIFRGVMRVLRAGNAGKPLMRPYLEGYFDLYWDLHLGVKGNAVPARVRQIGESFNTVLAYRDPTQKIVYDNYMVVRSNLNFLKAWIDERIADLTNGKTANPEKTFAWYWIENAGDGENFAHKDVVFECFHNFVAFSHLRAPQDAGHRPGERTNEPAASGAGFLKVDRC